MSNNRHRFGSEARLEGFQDPRLGRTPRLMRLLFDQDSAMVAESLTERTLDDGAAAPADVRELPAADAGTAPETYRHLGHGAIAEAGPADVPGEAAA
jgi:hypothetical protein